MADDVRLTDLQVIQRYSIAVRGETADRDDLVAALRADLVWLQGGTSRPRRAVDDEDAAPPARSAPRAPTAASRRAPAPAPRKPAAKAAKKAVKKVAKPVRRGR
ncbi:MAG TPA: hypothetical protein VNA12_04585 [Mycobacteriales bacterium]|nr:hypothetical protein [Mycobacteriales bacterium]